jgi:hypothetical protein
MRWSLSADLLDEGTSLVEIQLPLLCQIHSVDAVVGIGNALYRSFVDTANLIR